MADIIFSIDNARIEPEKESGSYVESNVDYTKIPDGAEISTRAFNKMTTSIPTPFARVFLFDVAFRTLNDIETLDDGGNHPNQGKAYYGQYDRANKKYIYSMSHYVVADALDMLEFIFEYGNDPRLEVEKWTVEGDLSLLKKEIPVGQLDMDVTVDEKHNLLYGALCHDTANGQLGNTIYIFKWRYEHEGNTYSMVIGGTSPLTLMYSAPNWRTNKPQRFYGGAGNELFVKDLAPTVKPVSLIERSATFRKYVYSLLDLYGTGNPFFRYVEYTGKHYEKEDSPLHYNMRHTTEAAFEQDPVYASLTYGGDEILRLKTGNYMVPLKVHVKDALDENCDFIIQPTVEVTDIKPEFMAGGEQVDISKKPPVVISVTGIQEKENPHYWYEASFDKNNSSLKTPSGKPYFNRELPNVSGQVVYPNIRVEDFFEDKIVKVGYRLDREHFITGASGHCEYLMPIKPLYFKFFTPADLKKQFTLTVDAAGVTAKLMIPVKGGTVKLERRYENKKEIQKKEIVSHDSFNMSIFPFYRLEGIDAQYNCYEVMLAHDGKASLKFYNKDINEFTEDDLQNRQDRSVVKVTSVTNRTEDETPMTGIFTTYYRLGEAETKANSKDGSFLFAQARFDDGVRGLVVPDWSVAKTSTGGNEYIFCVDFGTANTHVSYAQFKNGFVDIETLRDLEYKRADQVVTLNEPGSLGMFPQFEVYLQREFAPLAIVKDGDVEFPIRTLIFEKTDAAGGNLFGDMNIAFNLKMDKAIQGNRLKSNIKWENDAKSENRIKAFFTEIMWIIKNKVVSMDGNMNFKFIFTFPQSMKGGQLNVMIEEWTNARKAVRAGSPANFNWGEDTKTVGHKTLMPYEGSAPWYRSLSEHGINEKFMNIDIGGGTFDVIAVLPNVQDARVVPGKAFSAQFAANVLWGPGEKKTGVRKNGFLDYYRKTSRGIEYEQKHAEFRNYLETADSPSDVISYLFKRDAESGFSREITRHTLLRSLVVLHFVSIVYYVGRVLYLDEIECPSCMRFTGMGSMYIDLITKSNRHLTDLIRAILSYASNYELEIPSDFTVEYDHSKYHPKKITAEGGVMMWNTTLAEAVTPVVDPKELVVYGFEGDDDGITTLNESELGSRKDGVMERIEHFLGVFKSDNVITTLNAIGLNDLSKLAYELNKKVFSDSFDLCLMNYNATANKNVAAKEAIFFWPLKEGIHKLAEDYSTQNASC